MKTSRKYLLSFGLVLASVVSTYFATISTAQQGAQPQQRQATADNEYQVGAILFMQKAAEYRGSWKSAVYEYERLTEAQKAEKRANALESY